MFYDELTFTQPTVDERILKLEMARLRLVKEEMISAEEQWRRDDLHGRWMEASGRDKYWELKEEWEVIEHADVRRKLDIPNM